MSHKEWLEKMRQMPGSGNIPVQSVWMIPEVTDEDGITGKYGCEQCIAKLRDQTGKELKLKRVAWNEMCDFCYPEDRDMDEMLGRSVD